MQGEWTPERVEAARLSIKAQVKFRNATGEGMGTNVLDLARIGLAVVEADDATVEKVARAIYSSAPWSSFWHRDDAKVFALAALRSLADGGKDNA